MAMMIPGPSHRALRTGRRGLRALRGHGDARDDGKRVLAYFPHGGYSHQILGLLRGARLAYATNRTLIVPPLLPHKKEQREKNFKTFESRSLGKQCSTYHHYAIPLRHTEEDLRWIGSHSSAFPSWHQVIDLEYLARMNGVKLMNIPDFGGDPANMIPSQWCRNEDIRHVIYPRCTHEGDTSVVNASRINSLCGREGRVALIGSAFHVSDPLVGLSENKSLALRDAFYNFKPTQQVLEILRGMYEYLTRDQAGYIGVHIRYNGLLSHKNCNRQNVHSSFKRVFERLKNQANVTTQWILIGDDSDNDVLRCFNYHAQESEHGFTTYKATTVEMLIEKNVNGIRKLVRAIELPKNIIRVALDQFMMSIADHIEFESVGNSTSMYQMLLRSRKENRAEMLAMINGG